LIELKRLSQDHAILTAQIHRESGALIPGYEMTRHTPAEDLAFHRDRVLAEDAVWGAFHRGDLLGFIALLPGWIDHLYIRPEVLRRGIGTKLLAFAQHAQDELRLYTFQSNARARAFYEHHGFVIEELTDGERNEEKMPDITYRWRKA
jgi:ribosomal protein S18 acetylase RimI-like enzyme